MAPSIPAEIDLFTIPHSRMKELVNTYTQKVQCVDFRDCQETFNLLKELQSTLYEFKSHECIENLFIMDQLRNRLKQRHIYNSAVCNCHSDNRLSKMQKLVRDGKHLGKRSIGERLNFGEELQKCFTEFVQQFLPHMEEEENIFQPLMVEHFEYDELRVLKEVVLEQHELIKDPQYQEKAELDLPETDTAIKDFRDIRDLSLTDLFREVNKDDYDTESKTTSEFQPTIPDEVIACNRETDLLANTYTSLDPDASNLSEQSNVILPSEILLKIFSWLTPPDRGRCAQVCTLWSDLVYSSTLWKTIYPVQWARGIWTWSDANLNYVIEDEAVKQECGFRGKESLKYDEDADVDESEEVEDETDVLKENIMFTNVITYLLPRIGNRVEKLILDAAKGITSRQMRQALLLCPNVTHLSAAYTGFDYYTLKGISSQKCLRKLRHLDLQGCINVDDECLLLLAETLSAMKKTRRKCPVKICVEKSLWLCNRIALASNASNEDPCSCCIFAPPPTAKLNANHLPPYDNDNAIKPHCPFYDLTYFSPTSDHSNNGRHLDIEELHNGRRRKPQSADSLEYLNLSGCYQVSEAGLAYLLNEGLLQNSLSYLNLSSCFNISGFALQSIVRQCQRLEPENLFYCNGIINGPYPSLANGCDNLDHPIKVCCQGRMNV